MTNMVRGDKLHPDDQRSVLNSYIYRNTYENKLRNPDCVRWARGRLPPISDERWLQITEFTVAKAGQLDQRSRFCYTNDSEVPERKAIIDAWAAKKP